MDVEYTVKERIAFIELNRPAALNALTSNCVGLLKEFLYRMEDDDDVLVGVISGSGRSFCAGADVHERPSRSERERDKNALFESLPYGHTRWKPLIAAVHGHCLGAGLYLALMCELIVASEDATFQMAAVKMGGEAGRCWHQLAHRAPGAFATDVAITGRSWKAEEGLRNHMLDQVVAVGEQISAAEELARTTIMKMPPLAVRAIVEHRRLVHEQLYLRSRLSRNRTLHLSEDLQEAVSAFREKREPVFKGR